MRKYAPLVSLLVVFIIFLTLVFPAFADTFSWYTYITVLDNSSTGYQNLTYLVSLNNSQLVSLGYINSTGLNTNVVEGSTSIPYSMSDSRLPIFISNITAYSSRTYTYRLNNSPGQSDFPIMVGLGGNFTASDTPGLDLGGTFQIDIDGPLRASYVSGSNLTSKSGAIDLYISANGNVTASINSGETTLTASGVNSSTHTIRVASNSTESLLNAISSWNGTASDPYIRDVASDGTNVYAVAADKLWKIKISDMSLLATNTGSLSSATDIIYDSSYVYVADATKIYKISTTNLTVVATWTDPNGYSPPGGNAKGLAADGAGNLYTDRSGGGTTKVRQIVEATMADTPASPLTLPAGSGSRSSVVGGSHLYVGGTLGGSSVIWQITTSNMTVANTYTDATHTGISGTGWDGTYVYATHIGSTKILDKIDPSTFTVSSNWTGGASDSGSGSYRLPISGGILYLGESDPSIGNNATKVVGIDTATMTTSISWTSTNYLQRGSPQITIGGIYLLASSLTGWPTWIPTVVKLALADLSYQSEWDGNYNEDHINSIVTDGSYLYVAANTNDPAVVVKVNPTTMVETSKWNSNNTTDSIVSGLTILGSYLYAASQASPTVIYKIDKSTMTTVGSWTGAAGQNSSNLNSITNDGTYIYVGIDGFAAGSAPRTQVVQINPTTMATVATWVGDGGANDRSAYQVSNGPAGIVYAAVKNNAGGPSGRIYSILTSNMTTQGMWQSSGAAEDTNSVTYDGSSVYAATYGVNPPVIYKINPATMTTSSNWTGALTDLSQFADFLTYNGGYVYATAWSSFDSNPQIVQIKSSDMSKVASYYTGSADDADGATFIGSNVYLGMGTTPGSIVKLGSISVLGIYIDNLVTPVNSTSLVSAVTNTTSDWYFDQNNVMPYVNYLKISVGGVQKLWYQPTSMILSSSIPDLSGNGNTGTINWGTNPAGITVTVGPIYDSSYILSTNDTTPQMIIPPTGANFYPGTGTGAGLPESVAVGNAATSLGWSRGNMYGLLFLFIGIIMGVAVLVGTGSIPMGVGAMFGTMLVLGGGVASATGGNLLLPLFVPVIIIILGLLGFIVFKNM